MNGAHAPFIAIWERQSIGKLAISISLNNGHNTTRSIVFTVIDHGTVKFNVTTIIFNGDNAIGAPSRTFNDDSLAMGHSLRTGYGSITVGHSLSLNDRSSRCRCRCIILCTLVRSIALVIFCTALITCWARLSAGVTVFLLILCRRICRLPRLWFLGVIS